jgi:hypothetical protein
MSCFYCYVTCLYVCIPHSFLTTKLCNQGKTLCSSCNIPEKCSNKIHIRITSLFLQISSVGVKRETRRSKTDAKLQFLMGHPRGEVKKCMKYYKMIQNI